MQGFLVDVLFSSTSQPKSPRVIGKQLLLLWKPLICIWYIFTDDVIIHLMWLNCLRMAE